MKKLVLVCLVVVFNMASIAQDKTIHLVVALCDNINQGIVKVPKRIGNGQDPANNLYWGCGYGVKTFFSKSASWKLIKTMKNPSPGILERVLFRHRSSGIYMLADAYDGAKIKDATTDYLYYLSGAKPVSIKLNDSVSLQFGGASSLISYTGHNGLMDFDLNLPLKQVNKNKREAVILACASKNYFKSHLWLTGAEPLVWTTHLMCPEAYTTEAIIDFWIKKKSNAEIREKAAQTYNTYQKCGIKGARNLLVTGY